MRTRWHATQRLHELLDRYITAAGDQSEQLEDGGEGESEEAGDAGMGEDEGGSRSRRSADRNGNGGSGVMSSEEALQVARLLPNPSEGGLASFFEHLSYTQALVRDPSSASTLLPCMLSKPAYHGGLGTPPERKRSASKFHTCTEKGSVGFEPLKPFASGFGQKMVLFRRDGMSAA
eukprot:1158937-Pelagomonas_calceolata.AAC.4